MYERQNSSSMFNIFVHLDGNSDSIWPMVYASSSSNNAIQGTSTFSSSIFDHYQEKENMASPGGDDIAKVTMAGRREINTSVDSFLQACSSKAGDDQNYANQESVLSPEKLYEGTNINSKDENLFQAVTEALSTGSLTPLVKEELKYSIQSRRLKEGKSELKVEFSDPRKFEMSPEEVVKVENRRVQNRVAAQRFREKQKSRIEELQKKCQKIESENTQLRFQMKKLREERDSLRRIYEEHMKTCPLVSQNTFSATR